jgi:signal transduction histidine kinase
MAMQEIDGMQVQRRKSQSQDEIVQSLQQQVNELTSENRHLKEQLQRKEQQAAMIAHDLRGPLSPIINYAQMLARYVSRSGEEAEQGKQLKVLNTAIQRSTNIIIGQAQRMMRLVNDLTDASYISLGHFNIERSPCDIVALAQEIIEQLRPLAPYHTLVLDAPAGEINGNWDAGRLQQALGNLLDNAIKYSDERTTVTVHIWTESEKVFVSVHNYGVSIPPTEIGQLFRPYARLQATSGARQGSGLGLYITKLVIEAHQGVLRLEPHSEESTESQRGTTFTFELPLS